MDEKKTFVDMTERLAEKKRKEEQVEAARKGLDLEGIKAVFDSLDPPAIALKEGETDILHKRISAYLYSFKGKTDAEIIEELNITVKQALARINEFNTRVTFRARFAALVEIGRDRGLISIEKDLTEKKKADVLTFPKKKEEDGI